MCACMLQQPLRGMHVVFSGVRDKPLEALVESMGGIVNSAVSGRTTVVAVANASVDTVKVRKAHQQGIQVQIINDFKLLVQQQQQNVRDRRSKWLL